MMNYGWWINRKDAEGHNVFEGGFLGLDNISVFDRSQPLPAGYSLKAGRCDRLDGDVLAQPHHHGVGTVSECPDYEDIAIQIYAQFLSIANTIGGHAR